MYSEREREILLYYIRLILPEGGVHLRKLLRRSTLSLAHCCGYCVDAWGGTACLTLLV